MMYGWWDGSPAPWYGMIVWTDHDDLGDLKKRKVR